MTLNAVATAARLRKAAEAQELEGNKDRAKFLRDLADRISPLPVEPDESDVQAAYVIHGQNPWMTRAAC